MSVAGPDAQPLQRLVRETMIAAGGYWRPLAAVARLLEELGELSELLETGAAGEQLGAELADLWIITTALADQFLAEVAEPAGGTEASADLGVLLASAGPIARIVNHYDGPKLPRAGEPVPTLHGSIAGFHDALAAFAGAHEIDLAEQVRAKIARIHARGDIERFDRAGFDPSTAGVLATADAAGIAPQLPPRLWGAPELGRRSTAADRANAALPSLRVFAKAAHAERLEGFLIAGPPTIAAAGPPSWLGSLVSTIDPAGAVVRFETAGAALSARALVAPSRGPLRGRAFALVQAL